MAIRISLIGGSGSGKSAYFAGMLDALVVQPYRLGSGENQLSIQFRIKSIKKAANLFNAADQLFGESENLLDVAESLSDIESDSPEVKDVLSNTADVLTDTAGVLTDAADVLLNASEDLFDATRAAQLLEEYRIHTKFPESTTDMDSTEFTFDFYINNVPCEEVIITDYAGELIDKANKPEYANPLRKLCQSISESDALILMADTSAAAKWCSNKFQLSQAVHAPRMNMLIPIILEAAQKGGRKLTTLVALTKSDHPDIPDGVRRQNFGQLSSLLADHTYSTIFTQLQYLHWPYGIVPVTAVGANCTDANNKIPQYADIHQENIDVSMLFCLYNALVRSLHERQTALAPYEGVRGKMRLLNKNEREMRDKLCAERDGLQHCLDAMQGMMPTFQQVINHLHVEAAQIHHVV